ncbi:MAG TPA: (4Fe-4S)-binding protein, partial [Gemmatimonadales bacterium]|nr:(4Fe-4S)-binding protein [Gemmatimonadales bacterium]
MTRRLQVYATHDLVVTFDPNICRHSGICLSGLPAVFDVSRSDWIHPDAAPPDTLAELIGRCPSGALQAVRAGVRPSRPVPVGSGVTIEVRPDGPNVVRGRAEVRLPDGAVEQRDGSFSLCRCGRTGTAPFCDGSHGRVRFGRS